MNRKGAVKPPKVVERPKTALKSRRFFQMDGQVSKTLEETPLSLEGETALKEVPCPSGEKGVVSTMVEVEKSERKLFLEGSLFVRQAPNKIEK